MLSKAIEDHRTSLSIALGIGLASGAAWYLSKRFNDARSRLPTTWEEVGTVTRLLIYPIKSAKAIAVSSASATKDGLAVGRLMDRSFMVITEDQQMITGRDSSTLVTLATEFNDAVLRISNLKGDTISVDLNEVDKNTNVISISLRGSEVRGVDCGDKVAAWLSTILFDNEKKLRLLHIGQTEFSRETKTHPFYKFPNMYEGDTTVFNDTTSYNIATEASLQDLNSRLEKPITFAHFRPPIVIGGTKKAFDEDDWSYVKIGDKVILHMSKPCDRCALTEIDPATGNKDEQHLKEMRKYRIPVHPEALAKQWATRPIFSINCGIDVTGKVNVGDKVYVHRCKPYWRVNGSPNAIA